MSTTAVGRLDAGSCKPSAVGFRCHRRRPSLAVVRRGAGKALVLSAGEYRERADPFMGPKCLGIVIGADAARASEGARI
jgi:hypothetical protein